MYIFLQLFHYLTVIFFGWILSAFYKMNVFIFLKGKKGLAARLGEEHLVASYLMIEKESLAVVCE